MTAPTTHWSTTGQLHTGTVAGCEACGKGPEACATAPRSDLRAPEVVPEGSPSTSGAQSAHSWPLRYPRPGTCTACGSPAEQTPSGRWWHLGPACPNRSQTVFAVMVVEDGVMRETTDAERPARFRADDGPGTGVLVDLDCPKCREPLHGGEC